jgi:translation initiation factor SUI1
MKLEVYANNVSSMDEIDPFAEANAEDSGAGTKDYVHVRVQQRNGRKSLTTVQGLKKEYSYNKILKDLKKEFCCNGTVVQDPELGQVCFYLCCFQNVLQRCYHESVHSLLLPTRGDCMQSSALLLFKL